MPKELSFTDRGLATEHNCEALRNRVKGYLLELGARSDLEIRTWGCGPPAVPDIFPGVAVHMNVLVPGPGGQPAMTAHWRRVDLLAHRNAADAAGDCELISQIKLKVLPLFATRNVDFSADCARGPAHRGSPRLTAEVLLPDSGSATALR